MIISKIKKYFKKEKLLNDTRFSFEQRIQLYNGVNAGIDITLYAKPEYSSEFMEFICNCLQRYGKIEPNMISTLHTIYDMGYQMIDFEIIAKSLLFKVIDDPSVFTKKFLNHNQIYLTCNLYKRCSQEIIEKYGRAEYNSVAIHFIFTAIICGFDVDKIDVGLFTNEQLIELEKGIAYSEDTKFHIFDYIDEFTNADEIRVFRSLLKRSPEIIRYYIDGRIDIFKLKQIDTLLQFLLDKEYHDGLLFGHYIESYTIEQLSTMNQLLNYSYKMKDYFDNNIIYYNPIQIKTITLVKSIGNSDFIDIVTNQYFTTDQYKVIIKSIECGVGDEFSKYLKPEYNAKQLNQILSGIREGLDVSVYANENNLDFEEMSRIRHDLLDKKYMD